MKVYAFDVDETMETSNGPVTVDMLRELRGQGHIVGLCGALCRFLQKVPDWHEVISFTLNFDFGFNGWYAPYGLNSPIPKPVWLEYVMVGNVQGRTNSLGVVCGSADDVAARMMGPAMHGLHA